MGLIIGGRYEVIRRQDGRLILIDFGGVKQIGSQWYQNGQNSVSVGVGTPDALSSIV